MLALLPHAPRHPPRRRVVKQQGLDHGLEDADEVVVPPDVRELVGQQRVELERREPRERGRRDEDHRAQPPDDCGYLDQGRLQDAHRPRHAQPCRQAFQRRGAGGGRGARAHHRKTSRRHPRRRQPQGEPDHTGGPQHDNLRQRELERRADPSRELQGDDGQIRRCLGRSEHRRSRVGPPRRRPVQRQRGAQR